MSEPRAVLISDIHFTVSSLSLASAVLKQALDKAEELHVPLIIAGDLNDTKAVIRAEVANELIRLFKRSSPKTYILIGNHDRLNEKGESHSLNFLQPYATIVNFAYKDTFDPTFWMLPYYHDPAKLQEVLSTIPKGSTLIMHQGVQSADMGHYVKDSSSLPKEAFSDFRVISGHYHKRQDIKCGRPRKGAVGLFSYIGSPYTTSFGEAGDGPKGFQILMSDGLLEFVPTNLRIHEIIELNYETEDFIKFAPTHLGRLELRKEDLLWIKARGTASILAKVTKKDLAAHLPMGENFKLDKIPTDLEAPTKCTKNLTESELLDSLIDRTGESEAQKKTLKDLWRLLFV